MNHFFIMRRFDKTESTWDIEGIFETAEEAAKAINLTLSDFIHAGEDYYYRYAARENDYERCIHTQKFGLFKTDDES